MSGRDLTRNEEIVRLYRDEGMTLQQIGDRYGITRERIRQICTKRGVSGKESGRTSRITAIQMGCARLRSHAVAQKEEARYQRDMGCSRDTFKDLTGHEWKHTFRYAPKHPGGAYYQQMVNARNRRHIAWNITFPEWWAIWQESGKWALRGRGKGYCMARFGDSGAYEVGNVYICTCGQNFADSYLVHPWAERFPAKAQGGWNGRGYFLTKRNKARPFMVMFSHCRKKIYGGYFATEQEAAAAVTTLRATL